MVCADCGDPRARLRGHRRNFMRAGHCLGGPHYGGGWVSRSIWRCDACQLRRQLTGEAAVLLLGYPSWTDGEVAVCLAARHGFPVRYVEGRGFERV